MLYEIMRHLSTNDQLNFTQALKKYAEPIWQDKCMWYDVHIDCKHLSGTVIPCLYRHRKLIKRFTFSSETQDRFTMPINRVIREFPNLVYLNFANSRLLHELDTLRTLPQIVHLNV